MTDNDPVVINGGSLSRLLVQLVAGDAPKEDDEGQTKRTPVKTGSSPVSCLTHGVMFVCPGRLAHTGGHRAADPDDWRQLPNFRLLTRLLTQIERVLEVNKLHSVSTGVVEAACDTLVIGQG